MKAVLSVLGLVIAVAVVWLLMKTQWAQGPAGGTPPRQMIDVVGVKADLAVMGKAERLYLALHGSYASLEELQQEGTVSFPVTNHRGYNFAAEVDGGQHFKITASPAGPAQQGWPAFAIDESMEVTQQ